MREVSQNVNTRDPSNDKLNNMSATGSIYFSNIFKFLILE